MHIVIRIDGNGNAFQMIGFQNKHLNSLFMYADVDPISLTSFIFTYNTDKQQYGILCLCMLMWILYLFYMRTSVFLVGGGKISISLTSFIFTYNTDKQQYGFSVSNTSGIDLAYFVGNFDFTANYTGCLMIDYYNDYPYFNYKVIGGDYLYLFYITSNNYPQIMIKTKLDFFNGINYNEVNSESWWYLGLICIPFWNASYSDRFMPIIKPLLLIPNIMTDVFLNKKKFELYYKLLDGYLMIIYIIGIDIYNVILFNPDTLIYSQSFTVSFPYQIRDIITKTLTNW